MVTVGELASTLHADNLIAIHGDTNTPITAPVVESSREVKPGGVFVARKGLSVDGHVYIKDAVSRGAAAFVCEREIADAAVPYIQVKDSAQALGRLAAAYHGFPSRKLTVIGVTGTDGKTTTSTLIHAILKASDNVRAGLISTIAADFGDGRTADTGLHVTSPGAPQLQAIMAEMVNQGVTHVVVEMTSHGLAQGRLNGVDIDIAVMTNVTHEHLDYHGTWENYRDAKALMFRMLMPSERTHGQSKVAVINADDPSAEYFAAIPAEERVRYGLEAKGDVQAQNIRYLPSHTEFEINGEAFRLNLVGAFNVYNALAAICATRSGLRMGLDTVRAGLESVMGISGRMERIDEGQDFTAIVDFAHTPNALKRALEAGREMLPKGRRLIAVFGSAGLRDREKRRLMAETSAQLADFTVLTAEDPRTESLDSILEEMAQGCISQGGVEGETFSRVPDRGYAIYAACQIAQPGDVVMACGKGHEQSMAFGETEYPWDDRDAMRAALRGTPLATLPTADA
ncbi:MAG: UDP-N-acetylmuramoyl-L-alanyl-D-glutamate--2,6-diaminopimelate ligase [Chloroflexota bacterium]